MDIKGNTFTLTRQKILNTIWREPGVSRIELSRRFNLNKSTISTAISSLYEIGLVVNSRVGEAGPKGGRKPLGLEISRQFGYILGLGIGTDTYSAVAVNMRGEILCSHMGEPDPFTSLGETVGDVYRKAIFRMPAGLPPLLAVGLGLPGRINPVEGIIHQSDPFSLSRSVSLKDISAELPDIPVQVENDGNCGGWAELVSNKGESLDNFLYLSGSLRHNTVEAGSSVVPAVGFSIVMNRKILYGQDGISGEFQSIFPSISLPSFLNHDIGQEKKSNDTDEILAGAIRELSVHVLFLMNMLNLEAVVIGQSFDKNYRDFLAERIRQEMDRNRTARQPVRKVILSEIDDVAVGYGAAARYLEEIFSSSIIDQNRRNLLVLQSLLLKSEGSLKEANPVWGHT